MATPSQVFIYRPSSNSSVLVVEGRESGLSGGALTERTGGGGERLNAGQAARALGVPLTAHGRNQ